MDADDDFSGSAYARHVGVARKRAQQRWSALMARIRKTNGMGELLGAAHWGNFADFVRSVFMKDFLELFNPVGGVLQCVGPLDGVGTCPNAMCVDLKASAAALCALHLDHAIEVQHICDTWKAVLPSAPQSWDDGIQGIVLAHLLFGTRPLGQRPPNIALRCGSAREHAPAEPCHDHRRPHYAHLLALDDIRSPTRKRPRPQEESPGMPE
jgi:hypothetical protein